MSAEQSPATVSHMPAPIGVTMNERDIFDLALRKSKVYAASTLVPETYRGDIANCLIALNMSKRIGADELMVMQNLHIVNGKPGWSGKFLIATFNTCGRFSAMRFEWRSQNGDKQWGCRGYATELATGEKILGAWIDWKMVEAEGWSSKKGSKWLTMPEQMFIYRAGAFLVNAYAPEIAMGLSTVEELRDITPEAEVELTPRLAAGNALANINAAIAQADPAPAQVDPDKRSVPPMTPAAWFDKLQQLDDADELAAHQSLIPEFDTRDQDEMRKAADDRLAELTK